MHPVKKKTAHCLFIITTILFMYSCGNAPTSKSKQQELNVLAENYVRLGLYIGQYDSVFVDAYYGPDSLKPQKIPAKVFPKDSLLEAVENLQKALSTFNTGSEKDTLGLRAVWISKQLKAFSRRIKIFSGENAPFDVESKELYDVVAPTYPAEHYAALVEELNKLLPGNKSIPEKFQELAHHFIVPADKVDTVFKTAIAECRKRTLAHYNLPAGEHFSLEYVGNKAWSGYNWYKGNFTSLIQINTDADILIDRAIDVGSHESYPGHHVYNMLLEKNLYKERGWTEISLYPLFSPQSLIAEGSANYWYSGGLFTTGRIGFCKKHSATAGWPGYSGRK